MSVVVSDGLTGDRVDTVDGVLTYLTKASSVEVTVTGEGGNVAVETVEIEGGSGGLMSGPLGTQRVTLVEGVTDLVVRARCRRVETQESLTWIVGRLKVLSDRTAPQVTQIRPTDESAVPTVSICYLNGMTEAENTANDGAAWRGEQRGHATL